MNFKHFPPSLLILALLLTGTELFAGSRQVTIDGTALTASQFAIVLPQSPTPSERRSGEELQKYLEQMTGEKLAVAEAKLPDNIKKGFFIGRFEVPGQPATATLGDEGIGIFSIPDGVVLQGNVRGCLYSMYTFLQEYLGCRWFARDCIVVPDTGSVAIEKLSKRFLPPLLARGTDEPNSRNPEFGVPNKLNDIHMQWDDPGWGGHQDWERGIGYVHTFKTLVNPKKYFKTHPEYYSLRNGKRVPGTAYEGQLCLTNPEVLKIATEYVMGNLARRPDTPLVCVSQNDNNNFCTCEKCSALAASEGSQAGPIIHFVNAIAREVAKKYPKTYIQTIAYTYSRKPPKKVRAESNVIVQLCAIECCFAHPFASCPNNRVFMRDLLNWSKHCEHLGIWNYYHNWHHSMQPFPNFDTIAPDIRTMVANNVAFIYNMNAYYEPVSEFHALRNYLVAQTMWDPDVDTWSMVREFCDAYYGAASPQIQTYLRELHRRIGASVRHMNSGDARSYLLFPDFWPAMDRLFDQAEAAVAGDAERLKRVKVEHLAIYYTLATLDPAAPEAGPAREKFLAGAKAAGMKYVGETASRLLTVWEKNTEKKVNCPSATIKSFTQAPKIDGQNTNGEWDNATELTLVDRMGNPPAALRAGSVRVGYTDDALYIFAKLRRDMAATDSAEVAAQDDTKIFWCGDIFEVFIGNADLSDHVHLAVNTENKRFDARNISNPAIFNPKWLSAVSSDGNYWYCEMRIPFAELWGPNESPIVPVVGQSFRANFGREFYAPDQELQMWNPPGFHQLNSYGKLIFQ